jgi:excisionase family DNA binding protein
MTQPDHSTPRNPHRRSDSIHPPLIGPSTHQDANRHPCPTTSTTTRASHPSTGPLPDEQNHPDGHGTTHAARPSPNHTTGDPTPLLLTPTQAAQLLQVPESWLRRRAARHLVPCTFLGKHLRFSRTNLEQILADATRPTTTNPHVWPGTDTAPRRQKRPPARTRTDSRRPEPGKRTHHSGA